MRTFMKMCLGIMTMAAYPAQAATFCVDPAGGACSVTIQEAVDLAAAAPLALGEVHTISIKAATYKEDVVVANDPELVGLIIKGSGKTIIDPAALGTPALTINAAFVTVTGLSINNVDDDGIVVTDTADSFILSKVSINNVADDCVNMDNVDNAIVTGNKFFSCGTDGIDILGSAATVSKNKFTHIDSDAIEVEGDTHVIQGNLCARVGGCVEAATGSDNIIVTGNKTVEHDDTVISVEGNNALIEKNSSTSGDGSFIEVVGSDPMVLANKSKNDAGRIDVECTGTCTEALVERNNVISASDDDCFQLDFAADGGRVIGNSSKECGNDGFELAGAGDVTVENNKAVAVGFSQANGFLIEDAGVKTLRKNSATFSGGDGFDVNGTGAMVAHLLESNKSTKNGQDGFSLDDQTQGVTLTGNTATANIQEGIDNRGTGNTFNENKASKNREGSDYCDGGTGTVGTTLPDDDGTNTFASMTNSCVYP